ncbi:MAG: Hpt domain-containing protein [Bdellovibrionales bacterium]|nr:Hpt domain-containing protein [Bdellovibrionales bacterium]
MTFTDQEIEEFKIEAMDLLENAEKSLLGIDSEQDFSKTFDSIFRCFHNLKGGSGMMEMTALQTHVHELETILMDFKPGPTIPTHYVKFFLKGIDAARNLLDGKEIEFSYNLENSLTQNTEKQKHEIAKTNSESKLEKSLEKSFENSIEKVPDSKTNIRDELSQSKMTKESLTEFFRRAKKH